MNWLVKTKTQRFEVWSDAEYQNRLRKCQYYGARPFWEKVRKLTPPDPDETVRYRIGEIIPYKRSSFGARFAVIIDLFTESGQNKFRGIDIDNRNPVVSPIY